MNITQIFKAVFVIPAAWLHMLTLKNKPLDKRYKEVRKWSKRAIKVLDYNLEIEGLENIPDDGPLYFVSNHQGTLDPVLIVSSMPKVISFISKKENEKMFLFGRMAKLIDTIHFDRNTREGNIFMLREAIRYLKEDKNLLIFPEGTRSRGDKMNPFKEGALKPAYLGKATIIPITLNNSYCIDDKKNKNKDLKITYGKPITYEEYKDIDILDLSNRLHSEIESKIKRV